eukprot:PhF_6_TR40944/c0_g1_i2/m.61959
MWLVCLRNFTGSNPSLSKTTATLGDVFVSALQTKDRSCYSSIIQNLQQLSFQPTWNESILLHTLTAEDNNVALIREREGYEYGLQSQWRDAICTLKEIQPNILRNAMIEESMYYHSLTNPLTLTKEDCTSMSCTTEHAEILHSLIKLCGSFGWELWRCYRGLPCLRSHRELQRVLPAWSSRWEVGLRAYQTIADITPRRSKAMSRLLHNTALWELCNTPRALHQYLHASLHDLLPTIRLSKMHNILEVDGVLQKVLDLLALGQQRPFRRMEQLQKSLLLYLVMKGERNLSMTLTADRTCYLLDLIPVQLHELFNHQYIECDALSLDGERLMSTNIKLFQGQQIVVNFKKLTSRSINAQDQDHLESLPSYLSEAWNDWAQLHDLIPYFVSQSQRSCLPYETRDYEYVTFTLEPGKPALKRNYTRMYSAQLGSSHRLEKRMIREQALQDGNPILGDVELFGGCAASPLTRHPVITLKETRFRDKFGETIILEQVMSTKSTERINAAVIAETMKG